MFETGSCLSCQAFNYNGIILAQNLPNNNRETTGLRTDGSDPVPETVCLVDQVPIKLAHQPEGYSLFEARILRTQEKSGDQRQPAEPTVVQVIDPKKMTLKFAPALSFTDEKSTPYLSLKEMVDQSGALAAVNGGFFDFPGRPGNSQGRYIVGGLVVNYETVQNIQEGKPGVGLWEDGTVTIDHLDQKMLDDPASPWSQAAFIRQAWPLLIDQGEICRAEIQEYNRRGAIPSARRTAIGVTEDDKVVILTTESRISFYELAQIMKDLGCVSALNLDGGASTALVINPKQQNGPPLPRIGPPNNVISDGLLIFEKVK